MNEEHGSDKGSQDTAPSFGRAANAARPDGQSASAGAQDVMATLPSDEPGRVAAREVKVVKICKSCMVSQAGGGGFCVKCGAELVPIRSVRDSCVGEIVGGKYKIVEQIGSGGMGEVYLGVNEPLGQRVAVKFLSQKFAADEGIILRFLNEARSYAKVSHPNAVTLLEYGQHDDGSLYLITEFIEGKILTEVVKSAGPMSVEQIVGISTQLCNVLSAAHKEGVIHRDLKPDNIMLIPETRGRFAVKVLDFGIAKILDDDHHQASQMTETGSIFGTPEFMSPEQARGELTDGRSDLYAMGIILFFLTTARLPFRGKNKFAILNQQLNDKPPRPSEVRDDVEVPRELEEIILKCLNKPADERYQTADDLAVALEDMSAAQLRVPRTQISKTAKAVAVEQGAGEKPKVVVHNLVVTPGDEREGPSPGATGDVKGQDDGWNDSFVGTNVTKDVWEGELSEPEAAEDLLEEGEWESAWGGASETHISQTSSASAGGKAALLALVAVLLVGGAWYATDGFRLGGGFVESHSVDNPAAAHGLDMESLVGVERMLDAGDLESAQRSIQSMQALLVTPEDRAKLGELIERRQSAENLEKRIRGAIQGGQCEEADRLAGMLTDVSKGLRQTLDGGLNACRRPTHQQPANHAATNGAAQPIVKPSQPVVHAVEVGKPTEVKKPTEVEKPVEAQPVVEAVPVKSQETMKETGANSEKPVIEPGEDVQEPQKTEDSKESPGKNRQDFDEKSPAPADESEPDSPVAPVESTDTLDDGMALPPRQL